jgi:glutamyl-tRNA synthetase
MSAPIGRLAPSPTGVLHLGNARSFLLAWLDIRARNGQLLLRIEDLDGPRIRAGAEQAAIQDLLWLGLDWDAECQRQSERLLVYRQALEQLIHKQRAYLCNCTRRDVENAASAPNLGEEGPIYPGTCVARFDHTAAAKLAQQDGVMPNFRFLVAPGITQFVDRFVGPTAMDVAQQLGDFVIWKRADEAAYQLAVVVDDAASHIDEILRGDDLLFSAARQIQIYTALELPIPHFAHVPLIRGADGRRLAKRHGDTSLRSLREQGLSSKQLLGWLAWQSGLQAAPTPCTAAELVADFDLQCVPPTPVTWRGSFNA